MAANILSNGLRDLQHYGFLDVAMSEDTKTSIENATEGPLSLLFEFF